MSEQPVAGTTAEQPLFFKWVHDDDGKINWGRILLMLGLTVATAYLSVKTQRTATSPDFEKTIAMALAKKRITLGVKVQQAGKAIEDAGWAAYANAKS